jgi:hypothetical protein
LEEAVVVVEILVASMWKMLCMVRRLGMSTFVKPNATVRAAPHMMLNSTPGRNSLNGKKVPDPDET